jgi:hypothetical protein
MHRQHTLHHKQWLPGCLLLCHTNNTTSTYTIDTDTQTAMTVMMTAIAAAVVNDDDVTNGKIIFS